ncbi:MAG: ABC transporter ATP-binding protein [Myxococcota bacterium]
MTNVTKDYQLGKTTVHALRGVDLTIDNASFTVLHGPSGSGKSTVLNLLGCLDIASSGQLEIAGTDVASLSDKKRTHFRAHHIGFVFQNFNLIPVLTALENVEYPLQLIVPSRTERRRRAQEMLDAVGLGTKSGRRPAELSGGERQRVAVARAMVKQPSLLLADEPTANLDRRTGADLLKLMRQMQRTSNTTFVFSSHDPQLIEDADAKIHIEDGQVLNAQKTAPVAQG